MANVVDYYAILGISYDADESQIKQAFRKHARQFSSASEPGAKRLKEAFDVLTDPRKREQYDAYLAQQNDPNPQEQTLPHRPETNGHTGNNGAGASWEYLTLKASRNYGTTKYYINETQQRQLKNARFHEVINMLGEDGWEMVGIAVVGTEQTYVFKRPQ